MSDAQDDEPTAEELSQAFDLGHKLAECLTDTADIVSPDPVGSAYAAWSWLTAYLCNCGWTAAELVEAVPQYADLFKDDADALEGAEPAGNA